MTTKFITLTINKGEIKWHIEPSNIKAFCRVEDYTAVSFKTGNSRLPEYFDQTPEEIKRLIREASQ